MQTGGPVGTLLVQWGDVSSWVSALSTIIALGFAAIAAYATQRAYRIETGRDRAQAAFARRAQAALVSAWWGTDAQGTRSGVLVRNASETPVYQATISAVSTRDVNVAWQVNLSVVPPSDQPTYFPARSDLQGSVPTDAAQDYRVAMSFTDSTGIRWIRDRHGMLFEVSPELMVWADTLRTSTLDQFTDRFLSEHQVKVSFTTRPIETLRRDFLEASRSGRVPADVLVGPHDWIGNLVAAQAITAIELSAERRAMFVDRAIEAMTYRGKLYGIPYASDSIALLRNLELDTAPEPPATFEELLERGRALCRDKRARVPLAIQVGEGDAFHVYPVYVSAGGRLFVRARGGGWDADAIAGPESAAALARLQDLGERGDGILRRAITRERAVAMFLGRQTPYLLCAAWAVGEFRSSDIPMSVMSVSEVPPFREGQPTRSLVSTHGLFLARSARNQILAQELIVDYMTRTEVALRLHQAQPRTPSLRSGLGEVLENDPTSAVYNELCGRGEIIPSSADTVPLFRAFHQAECEAIAGTEIDTVMRRFRSAIVDINRRREATADTREG
jgi:arabinogalactan oligomer / maltooligosaccharide transport system substrate-binding protein